MFFFFKLQSPIQQRKDKNAYIQQCAYVKVCDKYQLIQKKYFKFENDR